MNSDSPKKPVGPYHHGNLRSALLEAVDQIVREKGVDALSLRECARRAGVSHGAPVHHFGDRAGLLTEFAAEGFRRLDAEMAKQQKSVDPSPAPQLRAAGLGYILFAQKNPSQFKVMFRPELLDQSRPGFQSTANASYHRLVSGLTDLGQVDSFDLDEQALAAWSTVHGFATLWVDGPAKSICRGADPGRVLDILIRGLTGSGR